MLGFDDATQILSMLPLAGYASRLSARPGERLDVKVSSQFSTPYSAELIRIVHADPNPSGPGLKYEAVPASFSGNYPSRFQSIHLGSYAWIPCIDSWLGQDLVVTAIIWPTLPDQGNQAVISNFDRAAGKGFELGVGSDVSIMIGTAAGPVTVRTGQPIRSRHWYRIWARVNCKAGTIEVGQLPLSQWAVGFEERATVLQRIGGEAWLGSGQALLIAAAPGSQPSRHFNGKIESPLIHRDPDADPAKAECDMARVIGAWDFSRDISSDNVRDAGPNKLDGMLVNAPARAMTGANWSGKETCWRHALEEYGAIHFHEDDLSDCRWETDFTAEVPQSLASGVYGIRLRCADCEYVVPFFVCPARGRPTSKIAYLAPTFTYCAYANHARGVPDADYLQRAAEWGCADGNPADHPEYGLSTYHHHRDGSGVCHASWLRPNLSMRPAFLDFVDPRGSGVRHFAADSHITDWLEAQGFAYDVVTDDLMDEEGVSILAPYDVVVTSTHPEYYTESMLNALGDYLAQGGRLVYLGGNGFYWRIVRHPTRPELFEIRRAEGGIRLWATEPGEAYHAFNGSYGGLWRRLGRPPQALVGVGFSAQGLFEGSYYRRTEASLDPSVAWMFERVEDKILGDFGLCGGGAGGYELDRADVRLGTPENAVIVAQSEGHSDSFVAAPEEWLSHVVTLSGEPHQALIRADMTYFETPAGGAVFSTGSITFCGSLSHNDYNNNISRLLGNVIGRFSGQPTHRLAKSEKERTRTCA